MAYSVDLRRKVMLYVESGGSRASAATIFNIGERTLRRWIALKTETGNLKPRPHGGGRVYKADPAELEKYVIANPDKTLQELGEKFNASISSIWRCLRSLNYVSKKNSTLRRKK